MHINTNNVSIPKVSLSSSRAPSYNGFSPTNLAKSAVIAGTLLFKGGVSALENTTEVMKQTASDLFENSNQTIKNLTENTTVKQIAENVTETATTIYSQFIGVSQNSDNASVLLENSNPSLRGSTGTTPAPHKNQTLGWVIVLIVPATFVLIGGLCCCACVIHRGRVRAAQLMAPEPVLPTAGDYGTLTDDV